MTTFCLYYDYILTISDWLTDGVGEGVDITNFWSIFLDDHCSKTIYRPQIIVWSGAIIHLLMILFQYYGNFATYYTMYMNDCYIYLMYILYFIIKACLLIQWLLQGTEHNCLKRLNYTRFLLFHFAFHHYQYDFRRCSVFHYSSLMGVSLAKKTLSNFTTQPFALSNENNVITFLPKR